MSDETVEERPWDRPDGGRNGAARADVETFDLDRWADRGEVPTAQDQQGDRRCNPARPGRI